jgi:C4-type Zn-finger protein
MRCPVCGFTMFYVTKISEVIYENGKKKKVYRYSRKCNYCDHEIEHWYEDRE